MDNNENKKGLLRQLTYAFAVRIVNMVRYLQDDMKEFVLSKQVLRSGTAIGALVREAQYAQSEADFVNKLSIALKETNETDYWLNLLHDTKYIDDAACFSMHEDCGHIMAVLTASINTVKKRLNPKR